MSGFSINWLNLREAADLRARDKGLLERAGTWLAQGESPAVIVDLGAGTGSTLRAFDSLASLSSTWRLVDADADVLAEAQRRHGDSHSLETVELDLTRLNDLPLQGARLVTASALFDLVSESFVDELVALLSEQNRQQPLGLYAALSYNGKTEWTPSHALDRSILDALNQHQRRDKGFGPALGPEASTYMERQFTNAGFEVVAAASPWVLGEDDRELLNEFIGGIALALADHDDLDPAAVQEWGQFRKANVKEGRCEVGHTDLLILPKT